MRVQPIPPGFHTVTPYLIVVGAARLIEFLKSAFGAVEVSRNSGPDGSVMHAEIRIGTSMVMLSEASAKFPAMPTAIYLYVPDVDSTYARAMKAGATSLMQPSDQFYGDRNAGVRDASGNQWFIGTRIEDVSPDEIDRRHAEMLDSSR